MNTVINAPKVIYLNICDDVHKDPINFSYLHPSDVEITWAEDQALSTTLEYRLASEVNAELLRLNDKVTEFESLLSAIWLQLDRGDRESVSDDELCGIVRTYVVGCARQLDTVKELRQQVAGLELTLSKMPLTAANVWAVIDAQLSTSEQERRG